MPIRDFRSTVVFDTPEDRQVAYTSGIVRVVKTGKPIQGVLVDVWEAFTNGESCCDLSEALVRIPNGITVLYEQQDPNQRELNIRGKFLTNDRGGYAFYCLRPTLYPVSSYVLHKNQWSDPFRCPTVVLSESYRCSFTDTRTGLLTFTSWPLRRAISRSQLRSLTPRQSTCRMIVFYSQE